MHVRRDDLQPAAQPVTSAVAPAGGLPPTSEATDRRQVTRQGVLLSARVDVGGSTLDCILLDVSPRGARLQFGAPVHLPEDLRLTMRDGSRHEARRCWSRGNQVGVEFLGASGIGIDSPTRRRARTLMERIQAGDPAAWLPALRAERYFGDEAVRQAAEAAEVAHLRLLAALRGHAGPG